MEACNLIVVIGPTTYNKLFERYGVVNNLDQEDLEQKESMDLIFYADLIVFTGGADVDPNLYGEKRHIKTHSCLSRDINEAKVFKVCVDNNIPMAGICRGSQFLTVMNGGKLVQHITNHALAGTHKIKYVENPEKAVRNTTEVAVTSTHHQMMYPWSLDYDDYAILAYSKGLANTYEGKPAIESKEGYLKNHTVSTVMEPEVIWYNKTNALCAQFHPEMMSEDSGGFKYYQFLLERYIFEGDTV